MYGPYYAESTLYVHTINICNASFKKKLTEKADYKFCRCKISTKYSVPFMTILPLQTTNQ